MARGAVRRHGEALQGTHRKGREPFGDDLGTGHHERTHRGATERAPRHNHAPRPADRGRNVFVVPRTDDVHTRQSSRHKEAGLAGRVREQMRHTVGRVAEGQRDAVATAQCRGHSRTARRRRVEQDKEELRHTRLKGEGTADDVVDVGNVPRHIRSPRTAHRRHETEDATEPATASWQLTSTGTAVSGNGRRTRADNQEQGTRSAPGGNPVCPAPGGVVHRVVHRFSTGCGKAGNKDGERTDRDSPTAGRKPQDAATAAPAVARKYSSTNCLTKQRHTVTGACQHPAM